MQGLSRFYVYHCAFLSFRDDAVKVIVVFTDGKSIDDPAKPSQQLRDFKGVKIYVVSLKPDNDQMNKIAGSDANVFG